MLGQRYESRMERNFLVYEARRPGRKDYLSSSQATEWAEALSVS